MDLQYVTSFGKLRSLYLDFSQSFFQQIASCSYDGILLGAVFVYMAYAISLLYSEEKSIEEFGVMFLAGGFCTVACKGGVYIPLAGVIAMVLWEMFKPFKEKIKYVIGVAIPFILVFIAQFSQRILSLFMRSAGKCLQKWRRIYNISYL